MFPNWDRTIIAVSASFHSIAILSTLFRLWYQWHTSRMWWDDAWAVLAFLADIACLVATLLVQPIPNNSIPRFFIVGNGIVSCAYPILMWSARISILTSMVRVSRPEGMMRYLSICTGILFGIMATVSAGLRIQICVSSGCLMTTTVLVVQTTMDCIADILLTALPVWSLYKMKLGRKRKILVSITFSATMVINIVTVIEAIACFQSLTSGSIIFEHVKLACTMIVCNLLVIATFVYRLLHKGRADLDDYGCAEQEFTTVDLGIQPSQETSKGICLSVPSQTTQSSTWSFRGGSRSKTSGTGIFVEREVECQ